MAQDNQLIREATPEEVQRMAGWVRWAYEQNLRVVYYPIDNAIMLVPEGKSLDGHSVEILQKGVSRGDRIQGSAGEAAGEG